MGSDRPGCGLAAAHKHTLWSRCYFHPACSPHPDLSHGQWWALGPRAALNRVRPHPDEADRRFRPIPLTGSCPAKARTSREMSSSYHYKVCRLTFNQGHCRIFSQQDHWTQRARDVTVRHQHENERKGLTSNLALCLALPPPTSGEQWPLSLSVLKHSGCC